MPKPRVGELRVIVAPLTDICRAVRGCDATITAPFDMKELPPSESHLKRFIQNKAGRRNASDIWRDSCPRTQVEL